MINNMEFVIYNLVIIVSLLTLTNLDGVNGRKSQWERRQSGLANNQQLKRLRPVGQGQGHSRPRSRVHRSRVNERQRSVKPNIIFIMTDDQDVMLGTLEHMPKTRRILGVGGANFENAFVTTPICCPSRSSILTGLYVHNHNVYTNNDNCSSPMWREHYETRNFGTYLSNAGYRTGYFGKYLNEYQGDHIPPGWTEWVGLIRNTRYYNYSLNFNGKKIKHGDSYKDDYLTDLIANDSVAFLKQSKEFFPNRPVAMVLSMPAPHGPEDSAPQYQHLYPNATGHRTPSWNFAPNPDKQWLLQYTGKMEPIHITFTDMLQRKRLQTLMSVDDAVEKVYNELRDLGELDNTYWLFSSDHGYHIGQYGLVKGKSMPYDFDTRVPFMMRGPSIPPGTTVQNIVLNVDIAPTLLDAAGIEIPEHMDGKSVLELFDRSERPRSMNRGVMREKKAWRDTFLIERGKITKRKVLTREKLEAQKNLIIYSKQHRLESECTKGEYKPPCNGSQQWVCRRKEDGNLRIYKCRYGRSEENEVTPRSKCECPQTGGASTMNRGEKKRQRQFLRDHVNQPEMLKPKFIQSGSRRRFRRSPAASVSYNTSMDFPPIADAGPSHILSLPRRSVTLDGSASMDDHGIVGFLWTMVSQPRQVDMVGTRTPMLRVSNLDIGDYTFRLTVTDSVGQSSSQTVHVIVKPARKSALPSTEPTTNSPQKTPSTLAVTFDLENSKEQGNSGDYSSKAEGTEWVDVNQGSQNYGSPTVDFDSFEDRDSNYDEYSEYYFVDSSELESTEVEKPSNYAAEVSCRVMANDTVACEEEVYNSRVSWQSQKHSLDLQIQQLKEQLEQLKDMKKQLRAQRPIDEAVTGSPSVSPSGQGAPLVQTESYGPTPSSAVPDFAQYEEYDSLSLEEYADALDYASPGSSRYETLDMGDLLQEFLDPADSGECVCDSYTLDPKQTHSLPPNLPTPSRNAPAAYPQGQGSSPRQQKWLERQERRELKKQERDTRREHKQVVREMKRELRREKKRGGQTVLEEAEDKSDGCHSKNMKCFSHSNEHWQSPPLWNSEAPATKVGARHDPQCQRSGLECTRMDREHWRVAPFWTYGPFCFCPNSNNNTYWCLRTINRTHNFLYCEFITGFISFYDMTKDPYQLRNAVYDLSYTSLQEMHNLLEKLKGCSGARECTMRYRSNENEGGNSKVKNRRRKAKTRTNGNSVVESPDALLTSKWPRRT